MQKECDTTSEDRIVVLRLKIAGLALTQAALAREMGVTQGQISRVLAGKSNRRSKLVDRLCNYVETKTGGITAEQIGRSPELLGALSQTWDGSNSHAKALAGIIRSLGALRPPV